MVFGFRVKQNRFACFVTGVDLGSMAEKKTGRFNRLRLPDSRHFLQDVGQTFVLLGVRGMNIPNHSCAVLFGDSIKEGSRATSVCSVDYCAMREEK